MGGKAKESGEWTIVLHGGPTIKVTSDAVEYDEYGITFWLGDDEDADAVAFVPHGQLKYMQQV